MRLLLSATLLLAGSLGAQTRSITISAAPMLVIGNNEADESSTFASIEGATRLPDGRIFVGDRGAPQRIRIFSPQGNLVKGFGRKGSGPGEIIYLANFYRCGDAFFSEDIENAYRMSVFGADATYKREFRFKAPQSVPYASACNAAQQFIHYGWEDMKAAKPGAFRTNVAFWFSGADDKPGVSIGSFPGSERWGNVYDKKLTGTRPLPFGKQPVIAIGAHRAYIGTADSFAIMVFDLKGTRIGTLRDQVSQTPVTKADIQGEIDRLTANKSEEVRKETVASYAAMAIPKTMPAYSAFVVDALDHLWVQDYRRGDRKEVRWTVFTPDGKVLTHLMLPSALTVHEIGADYVLGAYMDPEEAIPQVRTYKITRTP